MEVNFKVVMLPEVAEEQIQLDEYIASGTGKPASPKQLFKLALASLDEGICQFVYKTSKGPLRFATGTRKFEIMPTVQFDPNAKPYNPKEANGKSTPYWDYQANAFRAFSNDSVVAVLMIV